jgi:uncharacterized protein (TIGR02145 family)
VRAYATNSVGTAYGNEVSFTTTAIPTTQDGQPCPSTPTLTDIDGNTYNTVQIGQQCWMKENLRTTHYANSSAIEQGSSTSTTTPYWYYPNNDANNMSTYGLLYNWVAVMNGASSSNNNPSGVQGLCPTGWHLPSEVEWTQLTDYVSSQNQYMCNSDIDYIAKALASTIGWNSNSNTCAVGNAPDENNATGFSAMPAGGYFVNGINNSFGAYAYFWSTTEHNDSRAYRLRLTSAHAYVSHSDNEKVGGFSIRCLKDNGGSTTYNLPTVTTNAVSNVTETSATCGGTVTADGGANVIVRGVCYSTSPAPTTADNHTTDGSGTGSFTSNITGLNPTTTYYVRAYATNDAGTTYGSQVSFTTTEATPMVTTNAVSDITLDNTTINVTCGGNVTDMGATDVTARGVCWSTSENPTISNSHTTDGSGLGSFTSNITGLTSGETYYVRAYATNSSGTAYGNQVSLTLPMVDAKSCPSAPVVTDHEGNAYATVLIGTQCWMRENLRTTTSPKTGTYLVNTEHKTTINRSSYLGSKVAHWIYNDSTTYAPKGYGLLYNWCAAMDTANPENYVEVPTPSTSGNNTAFSITVTGNHRGICPVGWHLPAFAELNYLKNNYSNSDLLANDDVWTGSPTNASGFTARPAGYFGNGYSSFQGDGTGNKTYFWSCTNGTQAQSLYLTNSQKTTGNMDKNYGMSVRCIKD